MLRSLMTFYLKAATNRVDAPGENGRFSKRLLEVFSHGTNCRYIY
jgi:hypothetical protein